MTEMKCPLCKCVFSTLEDLTAHLTTHKAEATKPTATSGEVTLHEVGVEGLRELVATVTSVVKDCGCEICCKAAEKAKFKPRYSRWHITLKPIRENYQHFHVWITADSVYSNDPKTAGKGTQLGDWVVRLKQLGLKGGTVDELFADMQGKEFLWERAKIGRKQRETWCPRQLLGAAGEAREEKADSVQVCMERIADTLERGKAYTVEGAEANGVDFPSEVVEKAFELLAQEGKAFKLPTKPAKWFYEG